MSDKKTWQNRRDELLLEALGEDCLSPTSDLCEAANGFVEGFDAGRKDAINEAQVLVDALNRYKGLCVHWDENHHKTCGRPADEALAAWREKTGE